MCLICYLKLETMKTMLPEELVAAVVDKKFDKSLPELDARYGALAKIALDEDKCFEYFNTHVGSKVGEFRGLSEDDTTSEVPDEDNDDFDLMCLAAVAFTYTVGANPLEYSEAAKELKDFLMVAYYYGRWVEKYNKPPEPFNEVDL